MSFGAGVCAEVNRDAISSSHPNTQLPNYKQGSDVNHDGLPPLYSIKELIKAKLTIPIKHLNICQCDKSCLQWQTIFGDNVFDTFSFVLLDITEWEECMTYTAQHKGLIKGFSFHFWGAFSFVPISSQQVMLFVYALSVQSRLSRYPLAYPPLRPVMIPWAYFSFGQVLALRKQHRNSSDDNQSKLPRQVVGKAFELGGKPRLGKQVHFKGTMFLLLHHLLLVMRHTHHL